MIDRSILVLGVGNILMSDEGAGVYAIRRLQEKYTFSSNVFLLDGGTLGMKLLYSISNASSLIVADTAMLGKRPGTISRLTINDIRMRTVLKNSMHQLSFSETLTMAEAMGILPLSAIITIEPADICSLSVSLTDVVEQQMESFCTILLNEIMATGGSFSLKNVENHSEL
jgi:hydrogenase maturation protease